jgi:chorismate mutase
VNDPVVQRLREQIAERDRAVLDALNARLELVAELKRYKAEHRIEFTDTAQEERLLAALEQANPGPLSGEGVRYLWREILALMKREVP